MVKTLVVLIAVVVMLGVLSGCLRNDPAFEKLVIQNYKDDLYRLDHDLDWILARQRATTLHRIQQ